MLTVSTVKTVNACHNTKFRSDRSKTLLGNDYFAIFQYGDRHQLGFLKFRKFINQKGKEG